MTKSVFSRVFSYRQRDNNSPLENFLTEIFAFCFENDMLFRKDFIAKILGIDWNKNEFEIYTQKEYESYGRPDIEILFGDTVILCECKIEAGERINQLNDYAAILINEKNNYPNRHILFLTKYFEHKEFQNDGVKLHLARWFDVCELINDNHSEFTRQLKLFLKEQKMEKIKNFTLEDLLAMKTIPETMSKMDELLEQFKPEFEKKFGGYSKDSSRSTRLPNSCYINYVTLNYQKNEYWLLVGFFWWWGQEVEIPFIGLSIEIPTKKFENTDLIQTLELELVKKNGWEYEQDNISYFSSVKPITEFITAQDDNIPAMKKFIQQQLKVLYDLREKYPKILIKEN